MEYLTFEEYEGMGGALDRSSFCRLAAMAQREIDRLTFGRIKEEFDGSQNYKNDLQTLVLKLVDSAISDESRITHESTAGVCASFSILTFTQQRQKRRWLVYTLLNNYKDINGIPLCYRGLAHE